MRSLKTWLEDFRNQTYTCPPPKYDGVIFKTCVTCNYGYYDDPICYSPREGNRSPVTGKISSKTRCVDKNTNGNCSDWRHTQIEYWYMPRKEFSIGANVSFTIRIPTIYEPRIVGNHAETRPAECPYRGVVTKVNNIGTPLEITDNEL